MLVNFVFSLNIVVPWILMATLGFLLRYFNVIDESFVVKGNKTVFLIFLPAMLFGSIYNAEIVESFDIGFIFFVMGWTVLSFFVVWILCLKFIKDRSVVSAFVQGSCRSNVGALAIPLAFSILGEGALKSVLALAVLIPTYNIMCIIMLTIHSKKEGTATNLKSMIVSIAKNPSIISIILGIGVSTAGLNLPYFSSVLVSALSQVTVPFVLICLGASIVFRGFDTKFKYALYSSIIKVVAMPFFVTIIAYAFGFRGDELTILMIINGVPTAIAGYILVTEIGGDSEVASNNIILTTILSAFSLAIFIFIFKSLGVIYLS